MAGLHNALRDYVTLARGIKRVMGLDGGDEGTSRVSETLTPTFDVFRQPDHELPRGTTPYMGYLNMGAVAGQTSKCHLRNGTLNKLLVVERVVVSSTAAQQIIFSFGNIPVVGGVAQYAVRDTRNTETPTTLKIQVVTDAGAAPAPIVGIIYLGGAGFIDLRDPRFVITPGQGLVVTNGTVNTPIMVWYWWTERTALPGELGRQ